MAQITGFIACAIYLSAEIPLSRNSQDAWQIRVVNPPRRWTTHKLRNVCSGRLVSISSGRIKTKGVEVVICSAWAASRAGHSASP